MERKLATIQRIREIRPIDGADAIELAIINNWQVVVAKNVDHNVGDWIVYCEIDSFLPIREEFEFLRKSSYKKMVDGSEGFRLKTIKLRGQISQGLVLPISVLEGQDEMKIGISKQPHGDQLQLGPYDDALVIEEGVDVTGLLGIVKYDPPIPAQLAGQVKGYFPSFLRKTDEERVQNLTKEYESWRLSSELKFYATEKLDGSSATFYIKDGEFGVCSRNLELSDPGEFVPGMVMCADGIERPKQENTFWKVAREMKIYEKLKATGKNLCLQGELIGEGVQKNPYKIKGHTVKFYNAFDIDAQARLQLDEFMSLIESLGFETVPILGIEFSLPETIDELLQQAEGKSILNPTTEREGIVVRSIDTKISFKAISNRFLLKNEE
jgi:RNA ligase (TIGR02306 family)